MRSTGTASNDAEHAEVAELATRLSGLSGAKDTGKSGRPWLSQLFFSAMWLATLAIGAVAILRVCYHDGTHFLTWINAFTRYVYLPSYGLLLLALWKRRRWLAVANLFIVACHLYWIAPDFLPDRSAIAAGSATAVDGQATKKLRIFFANVHNLNLERGAMLREIRDANPDVIILVEFTMLWRKAFVHSPFVAEFPYGTGLAADQAADNSINIFSKLPLKSDTREWIADRCVETIEIPIGSQTLRLVGLHAPRPMDFRDNDYNGFWSRVVPQLLNTPKPLVVVGDFNATQYSRVYQELRRGGLRSAHEDRGRGYAVTWPNGHYVVPPIRIDQALLSAGVECLGISEGRGLGSDHKPLILDVAIPQRP